MVSTAGESTVRVSYISIGLPCTSARVVSLLKVTFLNNVASHDHTVRASFCFFPLSNVKTRLSLTSCGRVSPLFLVVASTKMRRESPLRSSRSSNGSLREFDTYEPLTLTRKGLLEPFSNVTLLIRMPSPLWLYTTACL